ncbi:hypothetical protein [Hymenobacter fodinae]|uniref:Uncharacterized protein n=1 Tax=Hymenobacter fodinae TaxID=2510796 RepID=A0A4Z0P8J5_9BACT|nr:hypothetical protein [Hymenobacter fodinae]TGE07717.1 hypothetical protein EU556_08155 [Hymenobacter fodinae]
MEDNSSESTSPRPTRAPRTVFNPFGPSEVDKEIEMGAPYDPVIERALLQSNKFAGFKEFTKAIGPAVLEYLKASGFLDPTQIRADLFATSLALHLQKEAEITNKILKETPEEREARRQAEKQRDIPYE